MRNKLGGWLPHLLVVMLTLPLFFWLRWQPEIWLATQLEKAGVQATLHGVHTAVIGFDVDELVLANPAITLHNLTLRPAWTQLLKLKPALRLTGNMGNLAIASSVVPSAEQVVLDDLALTGDLHDYPKAFPFLPIEPYGQFTLGGSINLLAATQVPTDGALTLNLADMAVEWSGERLVLGDYAGELTSGAPNWKWSIKGGELAKVEASGELLPQGTRLTDWAIHGTFSLQGVDKLAPVISAFAGGSPAMRGLVIGTLSQPQAVRQ